ncbi:MAG: YdcF family protein [Corynebacterium sp.]|uniref:YdcF family protein n=1 Tax=Corynebacterium sp. TaxID=1720 RepID=UPI0026DAADF9|nr:YdcF family protein [Corynebacterium sp.]MDO5029483.1 YdcF family protein [Corynebacterium sp.]
MRKILTDLGIGFGALLLAGGLRVAADSELRPPRLPNRRPARWVLPAVGAAWITASQWARRSRTPQCLTTSTAAALAVPGAAAIAFEAVRTRSALLRATVPAHTVIVLGCALKNDRPSDLLERRLRRATAVSDATTKRIICCGGVGHESVTNAKRSEADAMVEWLATHAADVVKHGDIALIREDASTNTSENIDFACELIGDADLDAGTVVVTSDFHVPRVAKLVRERGLRNWCVVGAYTPLKYWATSTLREFLAQFILWAPAGNARILQISRFAGA